MTALLADPLWLALISALGLARALTSRKATPLDAVLGRIPWPSLGRKPRRNPCTTAAPTVSTTSTTRRTTSPAPKAATAKAGTSRRPFSLLDTLTAPLRLRAATGQHAASGLEVRFDIGGEDKDGRWVRGGTGPLPAAWDDATPFPRAGRPDGETLRAARGLVRGL